MPLIGPALNLATNLTLNWTNNVTNINTNSTASFVNASSSPFADTELSNDISDTLLDTLLSSQNATAFNDIINSVTNAAYDFTTQLLTTNTNNFTTTPSLPSFEGSSSSPPPQQLYDASAYERWPDSDNSTQLSGGVGGVGGGVIIDMASIAIGSGDTDSSGYYNANDWNNMEVSPCHKDNPNFNCSRDEYVTYYLGPQTLPLYKALMVTIIFGGIFITGFLGNVLVCVVIVRHPTMHTATNYYLFSLAVSDLLYLLFGLPAEIVIYWHQYPYLFGLPFCKIRAFISEASTYVSVLTIVAFSMERFLAICHPLHLYAMSGFKRALRIIAVLWIVSFISAIPFGLMMDIEYVNYPPNNSKILESAFCSTVHFPENFPLFELSFCVFFVIPMIFIMILYGRMGGQIRKSATQQLGVQQGSTQRTKSTKHNNSKTQKQTTKHQQSRKAVIRMLAAVVITFFICWLPFHMQRLWFLYAKEHKMFLEINEWIFSIGGFTYYVSCTINPILYNVMSHRYRLAFKDVLWGKRRSVYYNNGFARDQSSFRENTMASTLGSGGNGTGGGSIYDRAHSVRVRSIRISNNIHNAKDRDSIKSNNTTLWLERPEYTKPLQKETPETPLKSTNVVVVVDNSGSNGRPKVYTENEAQESLISKEDETRI